MTASTIEMLRQRIAAGLSDRGQTLACVEIGSGGRVASRLTAKAGSSAYFAGGLVLTADSSYWPASLVGEGAWLRKPPGSRSRLNEIARITQHAFHSNWCLVVECVPQAAPFTVYLALRNTENNATHTANVLPPGSSQPCWERLVQYALKHLAEKLVENGGETA